MQIANRMVWSLSLEKYERMLETYGSHLYPNYKTGFLKLDLNPQEIPSLDFLNTRLEESGWGTVGVNGYISSWDFFALLRKKQFPVARSMRSLQDIDHAPAPDFIHDVLGHVALLFDDDITKTMLSMASLAEHLSVTYLDSELDRSMHSIIAGNDNKEQYSYLKDQMANNPTPLWCLGRLYHWVLEFGVTNNSKIFGAGILSSKTEIERVVNRDIPIVTFSKKALELDIDFFNTQEQFFAIEDFSVVLPMLDLVKNRAYVDA